MYELNECMKNAKGLLNLIDMRRDSVFMIKLFQALIVYAWMQVPLTAAQVV